jgi:hypothetical protein
MQLTALLRMIPFELERALCSRVNAALGRRPSSAPFLSGDTFRAMADHIHDGTGDMDPDTVSAGSVVFVSATRLREFADAVLPRITEPFVLITHQGDTNIDASYADIADDGRVLHWFAQNCMLEHPKVTPLPIGLEDRWRHNNGVLRDYRRMIGRSEATVPRVAFAFNIRTNLAKRLACYSALAGCGVAEELPQPLNASLYRSNLRRYMFVASPDGNGLDCHRTWEAMYVGCVPIVEDNAMTRYFKSLGLPMVIIQNWDELKAWTEDSVRALYDSIMKGANAAPMYARYWENEFARAAGKTPR